MTHALTNMILEIIYRQAENNEYFTLSVLLVQCCIQKFPHVGAVAPHGPKKGGLDKFYGGSRAVRKK